MFMKRWFQIVFLALIANLLALPAHAVVIYNTRAAFDAATGVLPVERFERGLVPLGDIVDCGRVLSSTTDDACFRPGDIMAGLSIGSVDGTDMVSINTALGLQSTVVGPNSSTGDTDLRFTMPGINAIGFDIYTPENSGSMSMAVELYDISGLMDVTPLIVEEGGRVFYGATGTNLTRVIINDQGGSVREFIDDVAFGTVVPEPSTMLLLGAGLAGLGW